ATVALAVVTASCGGGGDDGPEPLAYGKSATIGYEDANTKTATKIEVTVLGVRPGTVAELEAGGFNLDDDEKDASVLYVDAKYKNVGDQAVGKIGHVDIEDTKGERISSTIVINLGGDTFDKCPADNKGDLTPGAEHQHCSLFLVPKGRTAEWVRATDYTIADLPRVYWPVS
ncbi:MAG TPA: hypothetical protein VF855_06555, partial [Acidimicrobiales bacterium]